MTVLLELLAFNSMAFVNVTPDLELLAFNSMAFVYGVECVTTYLELQLLQSFSYTKYICSYTVTHECHIHVLLLSYSKKNLFPG